jgi:Leucine-rich repeat (LRR) protein
MYGNQIEFLEGLNTMQNLKELLINRNKIKSLNYLAHPNLQSLVKINASYNEIGAGELENIAHVTLALYNLKHLDLYGNEVFNNPGYKFRLTENSCLEKLDGLDVKGVIKDRLDRLRKDWQVN